MTQLYHIPSDASLEAVRRQLALLQSDRVVVVVPPDWTELDNLARMHILQRQAQTLGREIAVVTRHGATRKAAKLAGIPVFATVQRAGRAHWRMQPATARIDSRRKGYNLPEAPAGSRRSIAGLLTRPHLRRARQRRIEIEQQVRRPVSFWVRWAGTLAMAAVLTLVLLTVALYVLPAATITLVPGREQVVVSVPLTSISTLDVADPETGQIPARLLEVTIEETGAAATSGSRQKATENAFGEVVFSNLGNSEVRIPLGTIVSTSSGSPVSFRTVSEVTAPGGVGQRVTVPVEAIDPGINGNVRANTINTVNGALRFRLRVSNIRATGGGGAQLVPVVTAQDQQALAAQLRLNAEARAFEVLSAELEAGEWLPRESIQTFVIAQVYDQFEDDEADQLGLTLRLLVQGVAVNQEDSDSAMLASLQNAVPQNGRLVADTIAFQRDADAVAIAGGARFTATASAEYVIPIDPFAVRKTVAGVRPDDALRLLQEQWRLSGPPSIYRDPAWFATLPRLANRIQVRIEYEGALNP